MINKNNGDYTAAGVSGAVNGIVFATIALFPYGGIGFSFIPASIPCWVYGIAYVLFSTYGIKAKWATAAMRLILSSAMAGMLLALAMYPETFTKNFLPALAILLPAVAFLLLVIDKPAFLLVDLFDTKKLLTLLTTNTTTARQNNSETLAAFWKKFTGKG